MAERIDTAYYQEAILRDGCKIEIAFDFSGVCYLFDGRVPCLRCACVRRLSGHSLWIASHADLLLNGSADFPDGILDNNTCFLEHVVCDCNNYQEVVTFLVIIAHYTTSKAI